MAGRSSPNLKPISTRQRDDVERATSSTPKARGGGGEESPGLNSDSSSPWRRFFRGGSRYANSEMDSFGASPRNLMGFSPKAGSSHSHGSPKRGSKYSYSSGQINAYPPTGGAAGAVMMSLAEQLLTKKGLSLKDLHGEEEEEYAETGEKVGGRCSCSCSCAAAFGRDGLGLEQLDAAGRTMQLGCVQNRYKHTAAAATRRARHLTLAPSKPPAGGHPQGQAPRDQALEPGGPGHLPLLLCGPHLLCLRPRHQDAQHGLPGVRAAPPAEDHRSCVAARLEAGGSRCSISTARQAAAALSAAAG
jgi:hypothetical protein